MSIIIKRTRFYHFYNNFHKIIRISQVLNNCGLVLIYKINMNIADNMVILRQLKNIKNQYFLLLTICCPIFLFLNLETEYNKYCIVVEHKPVQAITAIFILKLPFF